ncbi:hypothetical protein [Salinimicrobium flavum]|uniref:Uncharacterized protein n=1 Tax=Salinimicrobium flavum TaxID=1737065 RepID=A0ABW5IXK1_9FLAO
MDTGSTLLGIGLLLLFITPIGYLIYNQSMQEKKTAKQMRITAANVGMNLSQLDLLPLLALGLDKTAEKLLVLTPENKKTHLIDLHKVTSAEVVKKYHLNHTTTLLDDVEEISLTLKNGKEPYEKVIFYREGKNAVTEKEKLLQTAIKWQKIVSAK